MEKQIHQGYVDMVSQAIYTAVNPPAIPTKKKLGETKIRFAHRVNDAVRTRKINIEFAKNSVIISHWADCADYDEERVREKILKANLYNKALVEKLLQ
jgi:hypothetical protein